jgi:hypothetical protein
MFEFKLEHLFSYGVALQSAPEVIGEVSEGIRINFYVADGKVEGANVKGRFRSGGGDWFTLRRDGVGILDVRGTIETEDGALIYISYTGVADSGENGYERFLRGDLPRTVAMRVVPRLQTAHPAYLWMNRLQCLGIGQSDTSDLTVKYDVYAIS